MDPTTPPELPQSEDVTRLLSVVDRLPVRTRERTRLIAALGLHAHTEWSRVELRLEPTEFESLYWSGQFTTPHELAHVCRLAQTVARIYGAEILTVAHIAVALAASSRQSDQGTQHSIEVVAEAFYLGGLEDSSSIINRYLEELEAAEVRDVFDGEIALGYLEPWYTIQRIVPWTDPVLRVALSVVLATLAARSGTFIAWPIAFGALIPLRDPSLVDAPGITRLPVGLRSRWPSLIILAAAAALFRLWPIAALLVIAWVVLEAVATLGEHLQANSVHASGPAMTRTGDARAAYNRVLRLSMRYPVRDRMLRLIAVAAIGLPVFLALAELTPVWPAFAALYLLAAPGRTVTALLYAAALVITFGIGPALPIITIVVGVCARLLSMWLRRISPIPIPAPWAIPPVRPLTGARVVLRARWLIGRGQAATASRLLDAWMASLTDAQHRRAGTVQMLRAWARLEEGRAGAAWELRDEFPSHELLFRTLVVARAFHQLQNIEGAQLGALKLAQGMPMASSALRTNIALFAAEVDAQAGLADGIVRMIPPTPGRRAFVPTIRLLRLAGTSLVKSNPALADRLLSTALILGVASRRSIAEGTLIERGGVPQVPEIEVPRADVVIRRSAFVSSRSLLAEEFDQWRNGCEMLFRVGSPLEVAGEMTLMADALANHPEYRRAALDCRVDALAALNSTRHDLTNRADRLAWWSVYAPALDRTLADAFEGKDWSLLAELIESARVQGDPRAMESGRTPPYVRAGGRSALEENFWQRPDAVPPVYDLEAGAAAALGRDSWWWSTWNAQGFMYWALVRPGQPPKGGRQPMSEILPALAGLHDALPIPLEGEDADNFAVRTAESALLSGPIAHERDLMRRLAVLLPEPLRDALQRHAEVNLVIAPAVEYGHVPWASIVVDGADLRLVEKARLAIAPPIALLAEISGRAEATVRTVEDLIESELEAPAAPVRGAIVDPGGDLPQARLIVDSFPADATILTSTDNPRVEDVTSLMQLLPQESTFVFAGHTAIQRSSGMRAALSLGGPDEIRAEKLITLDTPTTETRFPQTVLLLACGSGDLHNTTAGEWSTLGPAVLWSGASRAVVTSFPIRDSAEADRRLVAELENVPVHRALRDAQLGQLAQWRESRDETVAPGHWAGHVGIGCFTSRPVLRPHTERSVRSWIHTSVFNLLDSAARLALNRRKESIGVRELWDAAHMWGWDELFLRRKALWRRVGLHAFLSLRVRGDLKEPGDGLAAGIDDDALAVIAAASRIAVILHHGVLDVEHITAALMRRRGTTAGVTRILTGRDPRRSETLAFMLELENHGWEHTGVPALTSLTREAALRVYEATGINPEEQPERWYFTDRSL